MDHAAVMSWRLWRRCPLPRVIVTLLLMTSFLLFYAGPSMFFSHLRVRDTDVCPRLKERTGDGLIPVQQNIQDKDSSALSSNANQENERQKPQSVLQKTSADSGKNADKKLAKDPSGGAAPSADSVMPPFPPSPAELFRTHDVSAESPEVLSELYERARRADEVCRAQHEGGRVTGLFTHRASRVAYCFLPKAGCTFWIRVFSFLHNFTGDQAASPWQIPRLKVHQNPHSHGVSWPAVREEAQNSLRFMFVRHPFSRLWSAYLDKLFLPDFWAEIGVPAVRKLRGKNAKAHALRCGSDVTFPEFVRFSLGTYEPHWEPIHRRCDPCQFRPSVIGSMKTFARDSLFLLRRMGLEWVLKDLDQDDLEEKELTTLVDYNFGRVRSWKFYQGCVSDAQMASLLWRTFQMNGYIPRNATFSHASSSSSSSSSSLSSSANFSISAFKAKVVETFRASLPLKAELKKQKRAFFTEALESLPWELIKKVKKKYHQDMLLFGFDEENY